MGLKRFIAKNVKANADAKRWMDYDQLKRHGGLIRQIFQDFSNLKKTETRHESFEQAIKRLQLSEQTIQKKMHSSFWLSIGLFVVGLLVFIYAGYFALNHQFFSGFVTFIVGLLMWCYAYRENFNYFQMKQRRLGCNFFDWLKGLFFRG